MRVAMLQPHDAVTLSLLGGDGLQAGSQLMVIDDDPLALQLMCNMLERLQMRVDCQPDGRRALRELEERLTEAIILDLVMPDFDGFAVLDALRADERLRHLPVFLWTNMVLSEIDIQAPKIDGLTAARQIKANPATAKVVVVAFTAYAMKGDEMKMLAAGCDGNISKPIDAARFAGQVRGFLIPPSAVD